MGGRGGESKDHSTVMQEKSSRFVYLLASFVSLNFALKFEVVLHQLRTNGWVPHRKKRLVEPPLFHPAKGRNGGRRHIGRL